MNFKEIVNQVKDEEVKNKLLEWRKKFDKTLIIVYVCAVSGYMGLGFVIGWLH